MTYEEMKSNGSNIEIVPCKRMQCKGAVPRVLNINSYMNVYDEVLKNGDKTILIVLSEDEDMTYDEYYKAIASETYDPDRIMRINTFNYGNN